LTALGSVQSIQRLKRGRARAYSQPASHNLLRSFTV
jgi:hypothetical protein